MTPRELEDFLERYYKARGWDTKTGIPTNEKVAELELTEKATIDQTPE